MLVQFEFSSRVTAVLNHPHPGFNFTYLKGTGHCRDKVADVFEVCPAHAPGAVHKEHYICNGTDRASWEMFRSKQSGQEIQREEERAKETIDENTFNISQQVS